MSGLGNKIKDGILFLSNFRRVKIDFDSRWLTSFPTLPLLNIPEEIGHVEYGQTYDGYIFIEAHIQKYLTQPLSFSQDWV